MASPPRRHGRSAARRARAGARTSAPPSRPAVAAALSPGCPAISSAVVIGRLLRVAGSASRSGGRRWKLAHVAPDARGPALPVIVWFELAALVGQHVASAPPLSPPVAAEPRPGCSAARPCLPPPSSAPSRPRKSRASMSTACSNLCARTVLPSVIFADPRLRDVRMRPLPDRALLRTLPVQLREV